MSLLLIPLPRTLRASSARHPAPSSHPFLKVLECPSRTGVGDIGLCVHEVGTGTSLQHKGGKLLTTASPIPIMV